MAKDNILLTDLGHHGVTSFTSDSVNESSVAELVTYDTHIYQGAIGYGQQVSVDSQSPVPGEHPQQTVTRSTSGRDTKKEGQNLLYAQTATSTTIRHPAVRSLSADRPVMYSVDSLDKISSRNCHNRCLTILLVIAGVLATVTVIVAVLAYFSVLGDECTCDNTSKCNLIIKMLVKFA